MVCPSSTAVCGRREVDGWVGGFLNGTCIAGNVWIRRDKGREVEVKEVGGWVLAWYPQGIWGNMGIPRGKRKQDSGAQ
jgi:hypothetical protein